MSARRVVGDALGAPVEIATLDQIRRERGPGGIREMEEAYGWPPSRMRPTAEWRRLYPPS